MLLLSEDIAMKTYPQSGNFVAGSGAWILGVVRVCSG